MSSKMIEIQQERGKPLKQVIKDLWEEHGSQQAVADELGVTQGTISLWMLRLGLTFKTIIVDQKESA
jgi:transcriptional regulator with PAS, ATPase and Fis domain